MNKNDQDMIRKIKEKSEQVPVPKALEPRQIEAKLAGKKKKVWTPARDRKRTRLNSVTECSIVCDVQV